MDSSDAAGPGLDIQPKALELHARFVLQQRNMLIIAMPALIRVDSHMSSSQRSCVLLSCRMSNPRKEFESFGSHNGVKLPM